MTTSVIPPISLSVVTESNRMHPIWYRFFGDFAKDAVVLLQDFPLLTATTVSIARGDFILFSDLTDGNLRKTTIADVASQVAVTDLSDVTISSIASGDVLIYNASNTAWENSPLTAGEAIDITLGAGSVTISAEDASTTNKGVVEFATTAEMATGTSSTLVAPISEHGWVKINSVTASASATVDFTGLSSTYNSYKVVFTNIIPATDGASLLVRTSTDGGSSFDSGVSDYNWRYSFYTTVDGYVEDTADSAITLTTSLGTAANELVSGELNLYNPSAASHTHLEGILSQRADDGLVYRGSFNGVREDTTAVDAIRFLMSSGNIASGSFILYGLKA